MDFKFVNGKFVDVDSGSTGENGLGTVQYNSTVQTPNKLTNAYFGTTNTPGTDTVDLSTYTKPSNNSMFGDIFGSEGFGMNKGTMQGLGSIGQIGSGIGQLFLGAKQMGLAEDKFEFDKDMLNKQYAMAKENYDRQKARSESIGNQMQSGKV